MGSYHGPTRPMMSPTMNIDGQKVHRALLGRPMYKQRDDEKLGPRQAHVMIWVKEFRNWTQYTAPFSLSVAFFASMLKTACFFLIFPSPSGGPLLSDATKQVSHEMNTEVNT